ncbi:MAG: M23 family metallopeptidase [Pseudomonadota bacterium]
MRSVVTVFLIVSLAACATAPTPEQPEAGISSSLALCSGTGISNAPQTDRNRRIVGYSPQTRINGTTLYRAPVNACVSSGFGPRRGGASSFHSGVDLFTRTPAPVYAGGDGVVETVKSMRGYGRTIVIRHSSDLKTLYAHLSRYAAGLRPGDRVSRGDYIGHTGDTGNATAVHLHYEIIAGERARNPLTFGQ